MMLGFSNSSSNSKPLGSTPWLKPLAQPPSPTITSTPWLKPLAQPLCLLSLTISFTELLGSTTWLSQLFSIKGQFNLTFCVPIDEREVVQDSITKI